MIIQNEQLIQNPLVSVVIVTYNQVAFIEDTVLSAMRQACSFPFEIIVADDGSNDGARELLKGLQIKYPDILRLIFNEKNMMVTKNYFNAFMEARGKYIAPLDGDDLWIDTAKLSKQVDILERSSDVSVVLTGYQKYYEDTGNREAFDAWESPLADRYGKGLLKDVLNENFTFFPVVSSIMFRTPDIKEYRQRASSIIDGENAPGEGMPLFTHFALTGKFFFLRDVTTVYRIRKSSLWHIVEERKQERFKIKYAFQKINIAEFQDMGCYISVCCIKLILLYLYSVNNRTDKCFLEELDTLSDIEPSPYIQKTKKRIIFLSKHTILRDCMARLLTVRSKLMRFDR